MNPMPVVDLRSDTVTRPTAAMREAMARAPVGDDGYGEDPTVNRLQEIAAARLGKEAALFVPSGTMGNLVALCVHTRPGDEVVVEERSHAMNFELGGMAAVAGVLPRPVWAERGALTPELVEPLLQAGSAIRSRTGLIVVENTHNLAGGTALRPEGTEAVVSLARARAVPVHLDGARLFNAAAALGVPAEELAVGFDSVMLSLSKGLAAPAGALLLGNRAFVAEARRVRRMLGGGMRQAGVLAAAGIVALEQMVDRLPEDHARARRLAEGIAAARRLELLPPVPETNIVVFAVREGKLSAVELCERLRARGVLASPFDAVRVRMVTHYEVGDTDVDRALEALRASLR